MARYTVISIKDMRDFLKAEKGWKEVDLPNVHEYVFDFIVRHSTCVVRVYTSINKHIGFSRSRGSDAIRVCAVSISTDSVEARMQECVHPDTLIATPYGSKMVKDCNESDLLLISDGKSVTPTKITRVYRGHAGTVRGIVKSRRVHRVLGWRKNLKARVLQVLSTVKDRSRG